MHASRVLLLSGGLVLAPLSLSTVSALAAWSHDPNVNVPLCTATGDQYSPAIVPDGSGGAIVTWSDNRSGNYDIYAQRVSAAGAVQWAADGVALCTAASAQVYPMTVSDGAGGAIVTWYDYRSGNYGIYAQKVSAAGATQWTADGVALCAAASAQMYPMTVSDGAGGAIVTWLDYRSGSYTDVYAQRVSAAGAVQWAADGVALCTAAYGQGFLTIVSDGAGGAIVTWHDPRNGDNSDIYAQRVSAAGATQWTADGVALCTATGNQQSPTIASDSAGGAIVTWLDPRSGTYDIYAQRVSAAGATQWTADGVALCTATGNQESPTIASDGAGGAIVTWRDRRSGTSDIYAQKVSAAGVAQWAADGVALCIATGPQYSPTIVSDGGAPGAAGSGAIMTWQDNRSGLGDIYVQRVERFGYLGNPEPVIASVRDVPNDQGGKVKVSWYASWLDPIFDPNLAAYDVLRSVPVSAVSFALAGGRRQFTLGERVGTPATGDIVAQPLGAQTYFWEYLDSVSPLHYVEGYSYVAPTLGDSVGGSNPHTAFMVVGRNTSGTMFWLSAPDSGYSVDDLAPATPAAFAGEYAAGTSVLHWMENAEADLAGYRLHRGTTADFVPGPGNLVAEPADTGYVDVAGAPYYYKLCAVDVHGNVSAYATVLPVGAVGVDEPASAALALSLGSANPARGSAVLRWALPAEGEARLVVYDLAGRVVRELASGRAGAGEHMSTWDGRNGSGTLAPAGMYVARLEAAGRGLSVRFVLVR